MTLDKEYLFKGGKMAKAKRIKNQKLESDQKSRLIQNGINFLDGMDDDKGIWKLKRS